MSDNGVGVLLIFVQEVGGAAEGYLIDVAVYLVGGHADAAVGDGDGSCLGVEVDAHLEVAQLALEVALAGERLEFLRGVAGVAYNLAKENLVIAIEKLFDDGEDVLSCNPNVSTLHFILVYGL